MNEGILELLVSTNDADLGRICRRFADLCAPQVQVTIISQGALSPFESETDRVSDVGSPAPRVVPSDTRGLSASRNVALAESTGTFLLLTDDDVAYVENFDSMIRTEFEERPEADILVFQIRTPEGRPYKKYRQSSFRHTLYSIMALSSVELVLRKSSIDRVGVEYDERFGLGALYPVGEEAVFVSDCIKKGLAVQYVPRTLAIHEKGGAGSGFHTRNTTARGALLKRIYGIRAYPIALVFCLKHFGKFRRDMGARAAARCLFGEIRRFDESGTAAQGFRP